MNFKQRWSLILIGLIVLFISFFIYDNIGKHNKDAETAANIADTLSKQEMQLSSNLSQEHAVPPTLYACEPILSAKDVYEMSDLVIVGLIEAIEKHDTQEVSNSADKKITMNMSYTLYSVKVMDSLKNPIEETNVLIKCAYGITEGYDPRNIKQGEQYKFYLVGGKDHTYLLTSYRDGMQRLPLD